MNNRVVIAYIKDKNDNLLMGMRNDNGLFTFPAGHLNDGEEPIDGLIREVKEETGLDVKFAKMVGASFHENKIIYLYDVSIDEKQKIDTSKDPDQECPSWAFVDPINVIDKLHVPLNINLAIKHWSGNL